MHETETEIWFLGNNTVCSNGLNYIEKIFLSFSECKSIELIIIIQLIIFHQNYVWKNILIPALTFICSLNIYEIIDLYVSFAKEWMTANEYIN